jgi:transcriptional regulator with XRE-family HTH domain
VEQRTELGEFLRSRRNRLRPEDVGLTGYGERRRVPGLRREELAHLAGVSAAYYTRLEQGQSRNASVGVLDALARALRLNDDERVHLNNLARPARVAKPPVVRPERVRPGVRRLIEAFENVPALVLGRRTDVLAWNPLAHALLTGHLEPNSPDRPTARPNLARLVFLDPHARELYANWIAESRDLVAYLRMVAGRYPDDPQLLALVGELSVKSPEFAALWSAHPVKDKTHGSRDFRHPLVGQLTLEFEALRLPDMDDQRVVTYNAKPGSPSEAALRLLVGFAAQLTTCNDVPSQVTA